MLEVEKRKILAAGSGVINLNPKLNLNQRLTLLYEGIQKVVHEFTPDVAAVETIFHGRNVKSAFILGHARGVLLLALGQYGLSIHEYAPRSIKQAVTGNGNATKDQVRYMVTQLLQGMPAPESEDASDGLAIALCHFNRSRGF